MNCNIKIKTITHFKDRGLFDETRVIPANKLEAFNAENNKLTEIAKLEKDTDLGPLFLIEEKTVERGPKKASKFIMRAVPNEQAFDSIEDFNNGIKKTKNINDLVEEGEEFFTPLHEPPTEEETRYDKSFSEGTVINEKEATRLINYLSKKYGIAATLDSMGMFEAYGKFNLDSISIQINKDTTLDKYGRPSAALESTGNISRRTIFHEFLHPFVQILEHANPELYSEIFRKAKRLNEEDRFAEIEHYKENQFKEELVVRYLDRLHENDIPPNIFQRFLDWLSSFFFKSRVNNRETLKNLSKDTTVEDLYDIFKNYGSLKEEVSIVINENNLNNKINHLRSIIDNSEIPDTVKGIYKKELHELTYRFDKQPSYRTIEDDFNVKKLQKTADKISSLLETFFNISSRTQSTYHQNIANIITDLEDLKEKYKDNEDAYSALAVAKYMRFMSNQMKNFNKRLNNPKTEFSAELYTHMENYLSAFNLINDIKSLMNDLRSQGIIDEKTFRKYDSTVTDVMALFNNNKAQLNNKAKNYLVDNFASPQYFKEEYLRFKDNYASEARRLYPGKENASKRTSYVNNQLSQNRDLIANRTKDRFRFLIENSKEDISRVASQLNSEKALNNPIVQIFSRVLDNNEMEYKNEILPLFRELQEAEKIFSQGRSKNESLKKRNEKFLEKGRDGFMYLKGTYSIEFVNNLQEKKEAIAKALEESGPLSTEYQDAILARKRWFKANTVKLGRRRYVPSNKWLNDFSGFTSKERDYHAALMKFTKESVENTGGIKSLMKKHYEAEFYRMPSIHKTSLSRFQDGEIVGSLSNGIKDLFMKRVDDITEGDVSLERDDLQKVYTDLSGKEISYIPLHFRGPIEEKDQSYDLSTMVALELENSIKFKHRNTIHSDLNMFIDVLKNSDYTKRVGIANKTLSSLFSKEGSTPVTISGEDANILKLIDTIMKNRMYDKLSEYSGKIGQVDANKVMSTLLGYTSHIGMALNYFGATANFAVGSVNNMIESFAGDIVTPKNIKNAIHMYSSNMNGIMTDIGKPTNKSLVNQIMDRFNILGEVKNLKHHFEKNNKLKALFNGDSLQFMHNVGEHGMQAVLTLAVLDNVKMLNKNGDFIDENGKVVSESNAVSLRAMYEIDSNGTLNLKKSLPKDVYTTVDTLNRFSEGGEANVRALAKQMILRNHGQYDSRLQSEFQRHWYGKMMMMYKKHLEIPLLNRTRGLGTSLKKREDLSESELKYNYDLNKIDEGHYTSMIRFIRHNILPNLKALKLQLIMNDYNSLDSWEQANLRRAMAEVAVIGMFATTAQLIAAAAGDDDEAVWFAAYTFRRVQSDLSQYHNPNEAWRILKNPFASLRQIETVTSILETIVTPWSWDDVYQGGPYKGESVIKRRFIKMVPILTRKDLTAKQAFNFIDR